MKKVFIHAYCQQNLGDDMFVRRLVRRYLNVRFYMQVDPAYRAAFQGEDNLTLTDKRQSGVWERFKHRFYYRAFVKIGGSIFMEPLHWQYQKPFPAWQCRLLNGNKFIIGANFGPYYTDGFFKRAYSSLRYYRGICFRDKASYELFSELPQAGYAPDVLFFFPEYPQPIKGRGVGISVIFPERKLLSAEIAEKYFTTLAETADRLIDAGIPVRFLGFCQAEKDDEAIRRILSRMKHADRAELYLYDGDIPYFLDRINECETIIASRFHAMIIGFALHKRVLPVIYSPKQSNVLKDIGFSGETWCLSEGKRMNAEQIIGTLDAIPVPEGIGTLEKESEKQFSRLDAFLN